MGMAARCLDWVSGDSPLGESADCKALFGCWRGQRFQFQDRDQVGGGCAGSRLDHKFEIVA